MHMKLGLEINGISEQNKDVHEKLDLEIVSVREQNEEASVPKGKKVRGDITLESFMGKTKSEEELDWNADQLSGDNQTRYSDAIGVLLKQSRKFNWTDHWVKQAQEDKEWLWDKLQMLHLCTG